MTLLLDNHLYCMYIYAVIVTSIVKPILEPSFQIALTKATHSKAYIEATFPN